jgi:hypothetical protein
MTGWRRSALWLALVLFVVAACRGPENRDDADDTPTPLPSPTAMPSNTPEPPTATATAEQASPTTDDENAGSGGTATEEDQPVATESPTGEATGAVTASETTMTPEGTATPTAIAIGLADSLPAVEQLPGPGYALANQGTRTALELANSYSDSSAHLERLNEWGFKEHHFREFSREPGSVDDPSPTYVLTTVNEYADGEAAAAALAWLRSLNASQGHTFVNPAPELGDGAIASSVPTAEGVPSAIVFVQLGPRIYAYFAQSGDPLAFCLTLAESNTDRILESG